MRKKRLMRTLSILLCTAMAAQPLSVSAVADSTDCKEAVTVEVEERLSEDADKGEKESKQLMSEFETAETNAISQPAAGSGIMGVAALDEVSWRTVTDEELDHILGNTEWEEIGTWLKAMSEDELCELLKRDTILNKETQIEECFVEETEEAADTITLVPESHTTMLYYEYALKRAEDSGRTRAAFKSSSGYYQIMFVKGNETCIFQTKLSGLDKKTGSASGQKATISVTKKTGSNFVNFWQNAGQYNTTGGTTTYTLKQHNGSGGYYMINSRLGFTKPEGYTATCQKVLASNTNTVNPNSAECKLYYYDNGNWDTSKKQYGNMDSAKADEVLISHLNVLEHAGLGTGSTVVNNCFKIVLTPITYQVAYNGNGATGGVVSTQNCSYDTAYQYQPNGFVRQYTVTYDGNGGQSGVSSHVAACSFKGWGYQPYDSVKAAAGSAFKNLTKLQGGVIQLYAIWQAGSVTLPTAAREGYEFCGWSTAQGSKAAGVSYVPTGNETIKANWKANTYQVAFYDGISNEPKATQTMRYDVKAGLLSLSSMGISKTGYTFQGWRGSGKTFGDMEPVMNLTKVNGDTIALTAVWKANTDTPYVVKRYVKIKDANAADTSGYQLYSGKEAAGEEIFYGESDSTVTVPAVHISGYTLPDAQMVKIQADGSTVVSFYYEEEETKDTVVDNSYHNYYGVGQTEMQQLMSALNKGSDATLTIDGIRYTVVKNEDGTLSIRLADMGTAEIITIPNEISLGGKTYAVTEIQKECFKNNSTIKEINIGSNISTVGDSAFEGCTALEKVTMNDGITHIGACAFKGCSALTSISMPGTLQTIGAEAFMNCTALKKITLEEGLLSIGKKAFYNCSSLTVIRIPKTVLKLGSYCFGNCSSLKKITFATDSELLTMGTGVCTKCTALTAIRLPDRLTKIPAKAFYHCKKLKKVTLGAAATRVGNRAFEGCTKLSKVVIPKKVQTIGERAFYNCSTLKKVSIKSKVLTAVGKKAFQKCQKKLKFAYPSSKKEAYRKLLEKK